MATDPAITRDCRQAASGTPDDPEVWVDAAHRALSLRQFGTAARHASRALALRVVDLRAHLLLAGAQNANGEAVSFGRTLRRAATIASPPSSVSSWLGDRAAALGILDEAIRRYAQAQAAFPLEAEIWRRCGAVRRSCGMLHASRTDLRRSVALMPGDAEALGDLAKTLHAIGELTEALENFARALSVEPTSARTRSRHLVCLAYVNLDEGARFAAHREWGRRHGNRRSVIRQARLRSAKLRIGYLSADLRNHSIARNLIPIVERHDRESVEVVAYSASGAEDAVSSQLQQMVSHWRRVDQLDDEAVASLVASDQIDVLAIVAGHMEGNRIGVASHRAAPVQVTLFDIGTSGLNEVDYWVTDELISPERDSPVAERATETFWYVPSCIVHAPPTEAGDPAPCPAERRGEITFGSFSNPAKITPDTIRLWAETLTMVAGSRLLLRFFGRANDPAVVHRLRSEFTCLGVAPERIQVLGEAVGRRHHLDLYAEIDIALDTFPFNGSTTVFEALWMGVPVVSLAGHRFVSRMGYAHLARVGLSDLAVTDPRAFAATAARLASDADRRAALRSGLRDRLASSPLCDGAAGARAFETAFREMRRLADQPRARTKPP